jgi:hypothetical protein
MPINNGNGNGNGAGSSLIASTYTAGILGELGGGWIIEDRVDLPFVTEPDPPAEEERLPNLAALREVADFPEFNGLVGRNIRTDLETYDERHWTAQWSAWRVLEQFARVNWYEPANAKMLDAWIQATDPEYTAIELLQLARAARDERASALPEILSQHVEFITDFMAVLSMTPGSHGATYRVLHIGSLIGSYAALHYKALENWKALGSGESVRPGPRPRPSHFNPSLMPPVPVPGHPAFPSGHATQSMLMALCIIEVLKRAGKGPGTSTGDTLRKSLRVLARRIARNREIAGLHYPSDSIAGRQLAAAIFAPLMSCGRFDESIESAVKEWT